MAYSVTCIILMQTAWSDTKTKCIWPYLALVKGLHAKKKS